MPKLELFFLGSPRILKNHQPIEVDTRKAIALLAYLALTGEAPTRDTLANLLWPDYDQESARAAFRRTLSVLNKALGEGYLEISRESVSIHPKADYWLDVAEFKRLSQACMPKKFTIEEISSACLDALKHAIDLYRGDFLAGFTLRDSPNFDEWQFFETENLKDTLAGTLEKLVRCMAALGDYNPALPFARRWLALDPLREEAHRMLMQLYVWSGERNAALRQYRECVRILEEELNVPPLEETTQLYQQIIENNLLPPTSARPSTVVQPERSEAIEARPRPNSYPLIGRNKEWSLLKRTYESSGKGGYFLALEGEAGIGKTRLAEEFLAGIEAQGAQVISMHCYPGEASLAYEPFIEGLRSALANPEHLARLKDLPPYWLDEATRLAPELTALYPSLPPPPPLEGPGAQSHFFEGLRQVFLRLIKGKKPGVLFMDDIHWADSASLDLLTYLVRRLAGQLVWILITCRKGGLLADRRLQQVLSDSQRSGIGSSVLLSRLSPEEVSELVGASHPRQGDSSEKLSERLYQEAEGLPFFVVEYLTMLNQAAPAGSSSEWAMPHSVRDLLQSRLSAVDGTGWQLLTTAAVIGRSFDFDTLREASGRSETETMTGLEDLLSHGIILEHQSPEAGGELIYDFSHEKLREVTYEGISLARRRLLHRRIAEVLSNQSRGRGRKDRLAGQIAFHYQQAGQENQASQYFKLAGEQARAVYANTEAMAHYRTALALGYPEMVVLHEAIGDLQVLQGEYSAAVNSYETSAALGGSSALARLEHKLGDLHHRRGEWELAENHFQASLEALGDSGTSEEKARLYADWSRTTHQQGHIQQSMQLATRALKLAEEAGNQLALARSHNILGILARSQEQTDQAARHLEQSLDLAKKMDDPGAQIAAYNNLALVYRDYEQLDKAISLAERALEICRQVGDRHQEAALLNNLADLYYAAGQSETAMAHLKKAVVIFAEIGIETGSMKPEIWKLSEW